MKMTDLRENKPVDGTHFYKNYFLYEVSFSQTQKATQKWPVNKNISFYNALRNINIILST